MKYLYYPGCSLKGTGKAYETSLLAVFRALEIELQELPDWNCCGATAYMSVDEIKAFALAGRNLALAERTGNGRKTKDEGRRTTDDPPTTGDPAAGDEPAPGTHHRQLILNGPWPPAAEWQPAAGKPGSTYVDLIAPCSACYLVLNKAQRFMNWYPEVGSQVNKALGAIGMEYHGNVRIRHPLDVLVNDIGLDTIASRITTPLKGLKVAPYYGCQIVRPFATFDDRHNPVTMDRLLAVTGADVVDYPLKTRCCGGSLTGTMPDVGVALVHTLLQEASKREADVIATVCPLCQFNLDGYQDKVKRMYEREAVKMPVVYFTQLLGLALGIPAKELDLQRGIVPAAPILAERGLAYV